MIEPSARTGISLAGAAGVSVSVCVRMGGAGMRRSLHRQTAGAVSGKGTNERDYCVHIIIKRQ